MSLYTLSLFLTWIYTLAQQWTEGLCVCKDQTWRNGHCLGRLDKKKALMLLSWWPKSHSSALTATRGKIHTRPWRQTEGAADTSEPRIGFSFCGDGSISRPNGYIIGQCVFLSNEAWEFSVYLKLALNTDCQSRRKGSSPVRLAIFYLQAISVGSEMRENVAVTSCVGIHISVCVHTTNGSRWELWGIMFPTGNSPPEAAYTHHQC